MIGAIAGDIIGSRFEFNPIKSTSFELFTDKSFFTDDTILTVVIAEWMMDGGDLVERFHDAVEKYPGGGWGGRFHQWALDREREPYNSWGNGSAMRISPVGFAFDTLEKALEQANRATEVTHNHPEGIRGAQATAAAIYLARNGMAKEQLRAELKTISGYDLSRTVDEIRPTYQFTEACHDTVPEAIACFLDSTDYESAIRNSISLGGDADTLAAIAGGIAQAAYGVPDHIRNQSLLRLDEPQRDILFRFEQKFMR